MGLASPLRPDSIAKRTRCVSVLRPNNTSSDILATPEVVDAHVKGATVDPGILCIWGPGYTEKHMYQWLEDSVGPDLFREVSRTDRTVQKDNRIRHDVWLRDKKTSILNKIRGRCRRNGWHVRTHEKKLFKVRKLGVLQARKEGTSNASQGQGSTKTGLQVDQRMTKSVASRTEPTLEPVQAVKLGSEDLRVATLNVQGLYEKKEIVDWYVRSRRVKVLALQETLTKSPYHWYNRIGGMNSLNRPCSGIGERGLLLAVDKEYPIVELGGPSPNWIIARTNIQGTSLIIANVYFPSGREGDRLRTDFHNIRRSMSARYKSPWIIMGDWNTERHSKVETVDTTLLRKRGSTRSFHGYRDRAKWSSIDHIVGSNTVHQTLSSIDFHKSVAWVDRSIDVSDHWPMLGRISLRNNANMRETEASTWMAPTPRKVYKRCMTEEVRKSLGSSNRFTVLREIEDPDALASKLIESIELSAEDLDLMKVPGEREQYTCLSRESKRLVHDRITKLKKWQSSKSSEDKNAYDQAVKEAKASVRRDRTEAWKEKVRNRMEAIVYKGDSRPLYNWVKALANPGPRSNRIEPVRNESGELVVEPDSILQVWIDHYTKLAIPDSGHSRDPYHWSEDMYTRAERETITELDDSISQPEVMAAIYSSKNGKATGTDRIPYEVYKAADEGNDLGKVLFKLLSTCFDKGVIPEAWKESTIVSLPKKGGDITKVGDYRGISLINNGLKILCSVVAKRLSTHSEELSLLRKEQAGFRTKEECITQILTLMEILQYNMRGNKHTYLCFIDFKKAYDMVPHQALLLKLRKMGMSNTGRCYKFIEALYEDSKSSVRIGELNGGSIHLQRGLRQGCPMSPILFDLYIDDILDGCEEYGMTIPGTSEKCAGLLYADDLVLIAESRENLQTLIAKVADWATKWEMQVNTDKCGIMTFPPPSTEGSDSTDVTYSISDRVIPNVKEYVYLGYRLASGTDVKDIHRAMILDKSQVVGESIKKLRHFYINRAIPIYAKTLVLRTIIIPRLMYGAEVYGMSRERVTPLQKVIDLALNMIVTGKDDRVLRLGRLALYRELEIPPVSAIAASRRTRALVKFPSLGSWVKHWTSKSYGNNCWLAETRKWLSKAGISDKAQPPRENTEALGEGSAKKVLNIEWQRIEKSNKAKLWKEYQKSFYGDGLDYIRQMAPLGVHPGVVLLLKMRTGTFWGAKRLSESTIGPKEWLHNCPFCNQDSPETILHLITRCEAWETLRTKWLSTLIPECTIVSEYVRNPDLVDQERTAQLLGEKLSGPEKEPKGRTYTYCLSMCRFLTEVTAARQRRMYGMLADYSSNAVTGQQPTQSSTNSDSQSREGRANS